MGERALAMVPARQRPRVAERGESPWFGCRFCKPYGSDRHDRLRPLDGGEIYPLFAVPRPRRPPPLALRSGGDVLAVGRNSVSERTAVGGAAELSCFQHPKVPVAMRVEGLTVPLQAP